MLQFLLIVSLVPIAITLALRWWYGLRVLANEDLHPCRCDLKRWLPAPGDEAVVHRGDASAGEFGRQLRLKAMDSWSIENPRAFRSRENARRFGMAVPPLSGIIAVFAVLVAKIPAFGLVVIPLAATSVAAVFDVLALPAELAAIARHVRKIRDDRAFPDENQEESVIRCAFAHAWHQALPPILRCLHK